MSVDNVYLSTDNCIRVRGLKDCVTEEYINDAVITATLYDADDSPVSGAEDMSISYITGTDGDYAGEIPHTVTLVENAYYTVKITITGSGYQTVYKIKTRATYKGP